jgi:hypothetical protein
VLDDPMSSDAGVLRPEADAGPCGDGGHPGWGPDGGHDGGGHDGGYPSWDAGDAGVTTDGGGDAGTDGGGDAGGWCVPHGFRHDGGLPWCDYDGG